ncbi:MAG: HU family DNA-binding protein [Bryobacterales bacterium]|nr:HU family DNA-binding protein [Bryobacterales bacterium]
MMKLCKDELVREIARVCEVSLKDAKTILEAMLDSMVSALQRGERIELRTFGTFYPRKRSARPGRNPRTGAPVDVGPKTVPRFKPAQDLLNVVNRETTAGGVTGPYMISGFSAIEESGRQSEGESAAGA